MKTYTIVAGVKLLEGDKKAVALIGDCLENEMIKSCAVFGTRFCRLLRK